MNSARFKLAALVMRHRAFFALAFFTMTVAFAAGLPGLKIQTIFSDLLPKDDPFVQVFKDHPNFGNPLTVTVMIKRKQGDIYNADTLQKVWDFTRDIDLIPGINHDSLISIATEKARYAEATPYGVDLRPLMDDEVPSDAAALEAFRRRVEQSPNVRTFYVSGDESATLIKAAFIESSLDYDVVFGRVQALAQQYRDDAHEVYVVGQPILTGWVYKLQNQTYLIFAITLLALVIALTLYMRNIAGTLTPIICSAVAAIWGFGLVGWIRAPIEPLLMIVPLLLIARSFSHCVQFSERYYEIYSEIGDKRKSAEITMGVMMAPSILGVVTDALGILFIAMAPIPAMERFALFCGFWAFCIIPTGVFLIAIVLSYLPNPKNLDAIVSDESAGGVHKVQRSALEFLASLCHGKRARATTVVTVVIAATAVIVASRIEIGNPVEGSNLLWEDSDFNTAIRAVNNHFPGVNTLEIILEAKTDDLNNRVARTPEVVATSLALQALVEGDAAASPRATLSFSDYMMEGNRLFSGGDPKWYPLDPTDRAVAAAGNAVTFGTNPVNFSHITDYNFQNSTISLWYKDNKQDTVDAALASAARAVEAVGVEHEDFRVRLASGTIALQQAMNLVVSRYHWLILGMLNVAIFFIVAYAYRSFMASIIVLIPVNLSNFLLTATMHVLGIGLDINSVMVAVLGVGVGIDYGIYLLSRICEEHVNQDRRWGQTIEKSLTTTGKAIMFTATIMLIGITPWYLLSDLKFMADMGLLLVAIMLINMVLALVVLPLLVYLIKPGFVGKGDLLVGESVDLSLFKDDADGGHGDSRQDAPMVGDKAAIVTA